MKTLIILLLSIFSLGWTNSTNTTIDLTVTVKNLRNDKGVVQFALYNKDGTIPDEYYKQYYKVEKAAIISSSATVTFTNLPKGIYAVNILHDENHNGKIEKGWVLPTEGIGFSNIESISPFNKPNFKKASFELTTNKKISIKVIYF